MGRRITWLVGILFCGIAIAAAVRLLDESQSSSTRLQANDDEPSATTTNRPAPDLNGRREASPSDSSTDTSRAGPFASPSQASGSTDPGYLTALSKLRASRASTQLALPLLGTVIADELDRRGEWISLTLGEPIELGEFQDSNRRLIVRNGTRGARGYQASRSEFPLFFELLDLQAEQVGKPGNEQHLEAEHFDKIEAFLRSVSQVQNQ